MSVLYLNPFAAGFQTTHFYGPVSMSLFVRGEDEDEWMDGEIRLLAGISKAADALGANAVLGLEITVDCWAIEEGQPGLRLHAAGTAAKLESY